MTLILIGTPCVLLEERFIVTTMFRFMDPTAKAVSKKRHEREVPTSSVWVTQEDCD